MADVPAAPISRISDNASILRISDEKTMELLDLYRQEECLWNTNDDYYKDQIHRRRASEKIANLLDIPNFGPRHVLMKFKNLRNAYSQEQKKIARNELVGVSYRPSVFWYKKMDAFIRPHLQKARGVRSGGPSAAARSSLVCHVEGTEEWLQVDPPYALTTEIEETTSENDSGDSQRKRKSQDSPITWSKIHKLDSDSDEPKFIEISIPQSSEIGEKHSNIDNGNNLKATDNIDQFVKHYIAGHQKELLKSFSDLSSGVRALSSRGDDVFDSFGKYVAGLLRTLPHKKALEVQPQIVNLITTAGLDPVHEKGQDSKSVVKVEKV